MIPSQKSEYSRTFQVTGVNQNARRLLSTDLVNIKLAYFFSTTSFEPVILFTLQLTVFRVSFFVILSQMQ